MGAINEWARFKGASNNATDNTAPSPKYVNNMVLASGVAQSFTVPAGATMVSFRGQFGFYTRWDGGAAVVPTINIIDGTGSELEPAARSVEPGDTFSIISDVACVVTASYWK